MTATIQTRRLCYSIGNRTLVDTVDLEISDGEIIAVCGPNGAGKTTLLRLIAGELTPSTGEIRLSERPIGTYSARELATVRSVLPQETSLRFAFTVAAIVAMGRAPHRHSTPEDDRAAIDKAMKAADVTHLGDRTWTTLSGGERARVTLARVLAQDTPILLLDEPTAALDLHHQQLALATARDLAQQHRAIVAVLHDLNLAARLATRIALMTEGRLLTCSPPWQALTQPNLETVFQTPVHITRNPIAASPLVIPTLDGTAPAAASAPSTEQEEAP